MMLKGTTSVKGSAIKVSTSGDGEGIANCSQNECVKSTLEKLLLSTILCLFAFEIDLQL